MGFPGIPGEKGEKREDKCFDEYEIYLTNHQMWTNAGPVAMDLLTSEMYLPPRTAPGTNCSTAGACQVPKATVTCPL